MPVQPLSRLIGDSSPSKGSLSYFATQPKAPSRGSWLSEAKTEGVVPRSATTEDKSP